MTLTPAMKQYMEIKNKYRDCVVFFRMGDFYETFYDDAKTTSETLDIALTKRGIKNSEQSIPLAGVPYHALEPYLNKMIKAGHKVAIVEQLEDPATAKGIVKRGVVRVVTPGTVIDENMLSKSNNYIACVSISKEYGVSIVDISTGEFLTTVLKTPEGLINEIDKYNPSEIVLPMSYETDNRLSKDLREKGYYITYVSDVDYYIENSKDILEKQFKDSYTKNNLKEMSISSSGALLYYLKKTQMSDLLHVNSIRSYSVLDHMYMDSVTIKNLELVESNNTRNEKGTLFFILNKTKTSMGTRLLKKFLLEPMIDTKKINSRLNAVKELWGNNFVLDELRDLLKNISDIERLISRINYGNSNPRDLIFLQGSLGLIPDIKNLLDDLDSDLIGNLSKFPDLSEITKLIDDSIVDEPPITVLEGGFIKDGYDESLDEFRKISRNAKKLLKNIEDEEKNRTGIKSLKIRYNKIFGYYIDITKSNLHLVPEDYIKKQTLVNSERFITEELKVLEEKILNAEENMVRIEQELFDEIIEKIKVHTKEIQNLAYKLAYLDVLCSFAIVSLKNGYVKPEISTNFSIDLNECRHPVVEKLTDFVPNNITITESNRTMIITGPNMAGKSVYMRMVALNIIMAQIGCFVPANSAKISIVDKIFCRTGAIDDISQGQSTFMVEMNETAQILNNATEKSLVILDEIGRGTSTYDGVAIAWSVSEYLARVIKAKTLFATHYHVLNNLEKEVEGVKNYNIAVEETEEKIIFLRKVVPGGTDKSYGIHVAKLAGMPNEVIKKSKEIQFKLEAEDEISEKIIVETRKSEEKDESSNTVEEVDRLVKSKQLRLDQL